MQQNIWLREMFESIVAICHVVLWHFQKGCEQFAKMDQCSLLQTTNNCEKKRLFGIVIKHGVQFEEKTSDDWLKDEQAWMLNVDED